MKGFDEIQRDSASPSVVKEALAVRGYALIREVIPRSDVRGGSLRMSARFFPGPGGCSLAVPRQNACPLRGLTMAILIRSTKETYQEVFNLERFHALPHHPALKKVMEIIAGDPVVVHPKPIGRLIFPRCERLVTHPHQDYEFMRGDPEFYTVWITSA